MDCYDDVLKHALITFSGGRVECWCELENHHDDRQWRLAADVDEKTTNRLWYSVVDKETFSVTIDGEFADRACWVRNLTTSFDPPTSRVTLDVYVATETHP